VSAPLPTALLVDHPALPLPVATGGGVGPAAGDPVRADELRPEQRVRLAVQLVAVTALLGEFDLWPGRAALLRAQWVADGRSVRAALTGFPRSLSRFHARLGGGERATELTREAALEAIAGACGLPLESLSPRATEPGYFLEAALDRLLGALPRPLDPVTGAALWAVRLALPPLPDPGEVRYWSVPHARIAARLGGATAAALSRRGRPACLTAGPLDVSRLRGGSPASAVVVVGAVSEADLAALEAWADGAQRSAVAFGTFPGGWSPPVPDLVPGGRLVEHLAVTGVGLARARDEVERRRCRFDPLASSDRAALTADARVLFSGERPVVQPAPRRRAPTTLVGRWLSLAPEGLPEAFLVERTGLELPALRAAGRELEAVESGGWWRLAAVQPLTCDPLHRELAGAFTPPDPRRLRHLALGTGDPSELVAWARDRLSNLEHEEVRSVLRDLAPGELGVEVQRDLAEACLAELDLTGGRRALEGLADPDAALGMEWVRAVDSDLKEVPELPWLGHVGVWPRAVAAVGAEALRVSRRRGVGDAERCRDCLAAAAVVLEGAARRWYEIELEWREQPSLLADRAWRRGAAAGHPKLVRLLLRQRALQLDGDGRHDLARRFLQRAGRGEGSPGRLGLIELDLGSIDLEQRRDAEAQRHHLRALRLLRAAGFQRRTRSALFNLAVADLDRLEVVRAASRLDEAAGSGDDLQTVAERARLALARGEEPVFEDLLARLRTKPKPRTAAVAEGVAFLEGVSAMLRQQRGAARSLLERSGPEGAPWLGLLDALEGRWGPALEAADSWGVAAAAGLLETARREGAEAATGALPPADGLGPADALAVALLERVAGRQAWVPRGHRVAAARVLDGRGMAGWARLLRRGVGGGESLVEALAPVVDGGDLQVLVGPRADALLGSLGLTGLELRSARDGALLWGCGEGPAATPSLRGQVAVVPLGGEPFEGAAWTLTAGVLELYAPLAPGGDDPGEAETGIRGASPATRELRSRLAKLAPASVPVTLLGETGVGKELAAKALHRLSGRPGGFVGVNVAALTGTLLEAELFGSVKGAYTGAERTRRGLAVSADRGTLFLDEIGDLDLPLQVKLLRFLESREVRPVGAEAAVEVDVRIVAATHRDLEAMVREGSFRQDLFFRLAGVAVRIPPLRERVEDIPVLRAHFELETASRDNLLPVRWSRDAEEAMRLHPWPGNVRELRHTVMAAMVWRGGGVVRAEDLPFDGGAPPPPRRSWDEAMAGFRRSLLEDALRRNGGNRSAAARDLGLSRQTLLYHLRNLGIK